MDGSWLGDIRSIGRRRADLDAAFAAEPFVSLDRSGTFWTGGDKGRSATRAEFASLPIVAAAFRTAHVPPSERLIAQLFEQCLGPFKIGGVEAFREPFIDFREQSERLVAAMLAR